MVLVDVDDSIVEVHGHAEQGAGSADLVQVDRHGGV